MGYGKWMFFLIFTLTISYVFAQDDKYFLRNTVTSNSGLKIELKQREKNWEVASRSGLKEQERYIGFNEYRVTVTNCGRTARKGLEIIFFLADNVDYVTYHERMLTKEVLNGQFTCPLGDIDPGKQATADLIVQFSFKIESAVFLLAIHSQESTEFCYLSIPVFLPCSGCYPVITGKFSKQEVSVGEQIKYVIRVENTTSGIRPVQIISTIPPELQFICASGSFTLDKDQIVLCQNRDLRSGEKVEYEIVYKTLKPGIIKNFTVMQVHQSNNITLQGILKVR